MSIDDAVKEAAVADWPLTSGTYKVAQLYVPTDNSSVPWLRFYNGEPLFHYGIIMRLQTELRRRVGVQGMTVTTKRAPKVVGMGYAIIDAEKRRAEFYGGFPEYGLEVSPEHLETIKPLLPDWQLTLRNP